MKIGIASDSHGRCDRLKAALEAFAGRDVDAVVHCGDVCGAKCMELLGRCGMDAYVVAGNMDRHVATLAQAARQYGVNFAWEVIEVPLGGGEHLVATHGNDEQILGELIADQQFPYVCHGHTHRQRDERHGRTRVINPGALWHPRQPHRPTAAVLDTETDRLDWIELEK